MLSIYQIGSTCIRTKALEKKISSMCKMLTRPGHLFVVNDFEAYIHRYFRIEVDIHQLARPSLIYDSGVGKILPGLHSPVGLKISLTDAITLRSSGLKMSGM